MKIDRNAPCPCGSGQKYKKCHGAPGASPLPAPPAPPSWRALMQPQQLFAQALDHHRAGEFEAAGVLYEELRAAHPRHADVAHNLGLIALQRGDHARADALLREATRLAPERLDMQAGLGAALVVLQRFDEAVAVLQPLVAKGLDVPGRQNLAVALTRSGRPHAARTLLQDLPGPPDAERWGTLANVCTDAGDWAAATEAYSASLALRPDAAAVHSNRLLMAQYDERLTPAELLALHAEYGKRQEGIWPALPLPFANLPQPARRLRLGLVSGDFGEHPVGYLLLPWLQALEPTRFEVILYATRARQDALQQRLATCAAQWVDVHALTDAQLQTRLRADRVDVLVDLAGHTAGNRLPVFARRAAPLQVSLLGYPTTTGLSSIDLRLSDPWIDPPDEPAGTEPCLRLHGGLFRYAPPNNAPEPATPPLLRRRTPSFGVFGNYSKFSAQAVAHWAAMLQAIPEARLVLKAAALAEEHTQHHLRDAFAAKGVAAERLVCLPWTDHAEHLAAYAEIDILLDTLPFNLAANSCEALWMGVPLLSLAGERPAGRMGRSILETAGLGEWACADEASWIAKAQALLADPHALAARRASQRAHLQASRLLDGASFAAEFDAAVHQAWAAWCAGQRTQQPAVARQVLHVGCGHPEAGKLPPGFEPDVWRELRVDLDAQVKPDYVASIEDLAPIPDDHADALYSSHNVEHLFPSQVPKALATFRRVLKPGGFVLITLPDLRSAAEAILRDQTDTPLYHSPAGPITALDMLYGYAPFVEGGNAFMIHKTGFTAGSLQRTLEHAGFERVQVSSHTHALWALGFKPQR